MVSAHPAYATDRPTSDPLCGPDSSGGPEAFSPVITCSVGDGSSLGLPLVPGRSSGAGRATFTALSFIGGATLCSSIEDHHCCHHHAPPPAQVVSEGIATIPPAATAHLGGPALSHSSLSCAGRSAFPILIAPVTNCNSEFHIRSSEETRQNVQACKQVSMSQMSPQF